MMKEFQDLDLIKLNEKETMIKQPNDISEIFFDTLNFNYQINEGGAINTLKHFKNKADRYYSKDQTQ